MENFQPGSGFISIKNFRSQIHLLLSDPRLTISSKVTMSFLTRSTGFPIFSRSWEFSSIPDLSGRVSSILLPFELIVS